MANNHSTDTYYVQKKIIGPCPDCGLKPGAWETRNSQKGKMFKCVECGFAWRAPLKPGIKKIYISKFEPPDQPPAPASQPQPTTITPLLEAAVPFSDTEISYLSGLFTPVIVGNIFRAVFCSDNYLGPPTLWNAKGKTWDELTQGVYEIVARRDFVKGIAGGLKRLCPDYVFTEYMEKTIMTYMAIYALFAYMNETETKEPPEK